jgi:hypothetical protein
MSSFTNVKETIPVVVNSLTRLTPLTSTSGNFNYSFSRGISRISSIIIDEIVIPFTFYTINSTNNVLKFDNNTKTATITPGNYTTTTLSSALISAIDTAYGTTTTVVNYNISTFKLTISRGTAFTLQAAIDNPLSTLATALGFRVSSTNAVTATSDSAINISGPNYININSAFLSKPIQSRTLYANNLYNNTLITVPSTVSPGDIMTICDIDYELIYGYKLSIATTDVIDFSITDDVGNIIDLNGSNIYIGMRFITS